MHVLDLLDGIVQVGNLGVDIFFALSGFLLYKEYARSLLEHRSLPSARKFFARRALRILPAYYGSLALLLIIGDRGDLSVAGVPNVIAHVFMIHNWSYGTTYSINGPYWTMAVEAQFYIVLPLVGLAACHFAVRSPRALCITAGSVMLLSAPAAKLTSTIVLHRAPSLGPYLSSLDLVRYLPVFASGIVARLVYTAVVDGKAAAQLVDVLCRWLEPVAILAATVTVLFEVVSVHVRHMAGAYQLVGADVVAFACAVLLLAPLLGSRGWFTFLGRKTVRLVGIISYSLYIWNLPLYLWYIPRIHQHVNDPGTLVLSIAFSMAVLMPIGYVSYCVLEYPFISARRRQH